jgi:hypothetical protein
MRATTDHIFVMGSTHLVCEDYARSGTIPCGDGDEELPFAALADGCSSSPDTDIGARLLVLHAVDLAMSFEKLCLDSEEVVTQLCRSASAWLLGMGVSATALDATLLMVLAKGEYWYATVWGDGYFVTKGNQFGHTHVHKVECIDSEGQPSGHPAYPSYLAPLRNRSDRLAAFRKASPILRERVTLIYPDGTSGGETCGVSAPGGEISLTDTLRPFVYHDWIHTHEVVAMFSDGIGSFYEECHTSTSKVTRPVDPLRLIPHFIDFKGTKGAFVQRRARRVLRDLAERPEKFGFEGPVRHADDFSMAVLHTGFRYEP